MEEELASSYLRIKLSSILEEAKADSGSSSAGIISQIKSLNYDSDPTIPVYDLQELIELLSEWHVFRHTAAVSKKGWFDLRKLLLHPLSMWMFKRRLRILLDSIKKKQRSTPAPPPPLARRVFIEQTHPIEDLSHIIGFDAKAEEIEAWLLPQEEKEAAAWRAVGIVGRCGCGKTALAQKVFASPRVKKEFWPRIWVCLSGNEGSRAGVLSHILKEIGHEHDVTSVSYEQLREMVERGLKGKRYLIVLDEAWPLDELLSLPKESGGAVIVTSRMGKAIGGMVGDDPDQVIWVEPQLSHEICCQIFSQVFQEKADLEHIKLAAIQDDLKRNIERLPLAAKTLGTILPGLLLKSYWIRARDITIVWGSDTRYWRWISLSPPHQEEEAVAELLEVCWLDIKVTVTMNYKFLFKSYSAYLVFKLNKNSKNPNKGTGRLKIFRDDKLESEKTCTVFLHHKEEEEEAAAAAAAKEGEEVVVQYYPQVRGGEEGWMEIKLGEFVTTKDERVETAFEAATSKWKSGLVVKGIEIRPSYPPKL